MTAAQTKTAAASAPCAPHTPRKISAGTFRDGRVAVDTGAYLSRESFRLLIASNAEAAQLVARLIASGPSSLPDHLVPVQGDSEWYQWQDDGIPASTWEDAAICLAGECAAVARHLEGGPDVYNFLGTLRQVVAAAEGA